MVQFLVNLIEFVPVITRQGSLNFVYLMVSNRAGCLAPPCTFRDYFISYLLRSITVDLSPTCPSFCSTV